MNNSKNEWIPQNKPKNNSSGSIEDSSNYMTKEEVDAAILAATQNMVLNSDLKTINGMSLIGEGDLELSTIIPISAILVSILHSSMLFKAVTTHN